MTEPIPDVRTLVSNLATRLHYVETTYVPMDLNTVIPVDIGLRMFDESQARHDREVEIRTLERAAADLQQECARVYHEETACPDCQENAAWLRERAKSLGEA